MNGDPGVTIDAPAVSEEDEFRADTYRLLGNLLARVPDEQLLDRLRSIEVPEDEQEADMAAAWKTLAVAARR
ncbi:MAG: hypothetical protein WB783_20240, partial [Arenicellales bacterium]